MKTILLTGADGFAAQSVARVLENAGHCVIRLSRMDGDVAQPGTFHGIKDKITHVVHMAARTYVPLSWEEPGEFFRSNVIGTNCALDFCRQHNAHMLYISSYIYGPPEHLPVSETAAVSANNPYMKSKHMAEDLCQFYANHYSMDVCVLRPFNIYGPYQKKEFLIPQIISDALFSTEIRVMDLYPRRDYIYVDDFARAGLLCLDTTGYNVYNVGAGHSYSVEDIIACVQSVLGTNKPVWELGEKRRNEISDIIADIRKITGEIGWRPETSLDKGLLLTAQKIKEARNGEHPNK